MNPIDPSSADVVVTLVLDASPPQVEVWLNAQSVLRLTPDAVNHDTLNQVRQLLAEHGHSFPPAFTPELLDAIRTRIAAVVARLDAKLPGDHEITAKDLRFLATGPGVSWIGLEQERFHMWIHRHVAVAEVHLRELAPQIEAELQPLLPEGVRVRVKLGA